MSRTGIMSVSPGPARRSRGLELSINLTLIVVSVLVTLLAAEIALRLRHGTASLLDYRNLIADPARMPGRARTMVPDPLLGYAPRPGYHGIEDGKMVTFDGDGLRVHHRGDPPPEVTNPPILAVGDPYVMGLEAADNDTWPAGLERLLDHRVLNAGVRGYGIDQTVLRAEQLVPVYRPDLLLVGFIADDIGRAEHRVLWGVDKPYFDVVDGALALRNVPVKATERPVDPAPLDAMRRVLGHSYLADFVTEHLGLAAWWHRDQIARRERAHRDGLRVACLLMERLRQLHDAQGVRVVVVGQYSVMTWLQADVRRHEQQVTGEVLACARSAGLDTLDSYAAIAQAVQSKGVHAWYASRHMNGRGNHLMAELIAAHLK
jgi:hypothetical protein